MAAVESGRKSLTLPNVALKWKSSGYDIKPCPESGIKFLATKEEVLAKADYISVHTGGKDVIIGAKELAIMKPTAYIINTSRGNNIDQQALYCALKDGKIGGYATDVYKEEPKAENDPFT